MVWLAFSGLTASALLRLMICAIATSSGVRQRAGLCLGRRYGPLPRRRLAHCRPHRALEGQAQLAHQFRMPS